MWKIETASPLPPDNGSGSAFSLCIAFRFCPNCSHGVDDHQLLMKQSELNVNYGMLYGPALTGEMDVNLKFIPDTVTTSQYATVLLKVKNSMHLH